MLDTGALPCYILLMLSDPYEQMDDQDHADMGAWFDNFDNGPVLVRVRHTGRTRVVRRLEGTITLRESAHDPVVDIPVRKQLRMAYSEGDVYTHGEILTRVPGESFLPYMFGKLDDLELLAQEVGTGVVRS